MTGAESLLRTLVTNGVDTCFMNPGTSEMHFVAALDRVPGMRGVLCLFEGVCSGAADGYARVLGQPASTLLHLGPGLANGLANFHNARKARSPIVNIVGEHATQHLVVDAPLSADIATFAKTVSGYVRTATSADDIGQATAETILAAWGPPGVVASLIIPADYSWSQATVGGPVVVPKVRTMPEFGRLEKAAELVRKPGTAILLGGAASNRKALEAGARLAAATGVKIIVARNSGSQVGGRDSYDIPQVPYFPEGALPMFADVQNLILVEAERPVSFFAYPGIPSEMTAPGCVDFVLASRSEDGTAAMLALADGCPRVWLGDAESLTAPSDDAALTLEAVGRTVAALMPEGAIIADELVSSAGEVHAQLRHAAPFDFLPVTGGSIGQGLPVAVGAAIAAPHRKVISLEADGSAMYTLQALWTMVRENLDVTVVIMNNRRYKILEIEMRRTGANGFGPLANDMIDISRPDLDFVKLAEGMGVEASRARTAREFAEQFGDAMGRPGPRLIEACVA